MEAEERVCQLQYFGSQRKDGYGCNVREDDNNPYAKLCEEVVKHGEITVWAGGDVVLIWADQRVKGIRSGKGVCTAIKRSAYLYCELIPFLCLMESDSICANAEGVKN